MAKWRLWAGATAVIGLTAGLFALRAQDAVPAELQLPVSDANCTFFGPNHDKLAGIATPAAGALTIQVANLLPSAASGPAANAMPAPPGGSRTDNDQHPAGTIDKYIFQALSAAGVASGSADYGL